MKKYLMKIYHFGKNIIFNFKGFIYKKDFLKNISSYNFSKYSKIIIFESTFGWSTLMRQRPQQIALNFSEDVLFFYHSDRKEFNNKFSFEKIKENLILINLNMYRNLLINFIKKLNCKKYLMIYSTSIINNNLIKKYQKNGFKIIYEYVDDISDTLSGIEGAKLLLNTFNNIIKNNNSIIICTADKLYKNILKINKNANAHLVTNGCDYEHFKYKNIRKPSDMIFKSNKPIVGYYGALASWFDYDLLKEIANINKYEIVLIGIKYDNSFDLNNLNKFNNIHYLGKKDYEDLPKYSSNFDICIIPFLINDITLSTSPVKIFEYMCAEKPIVTTALPECKKYSSVIISENHNEFINNLDKAINLKNNFNYINKLKLDALNNTWKNKCKQIENILEKE